MALPGRRWYVRPAMFRCAILLTILLVGSRCAPSQDSVEPQPQARPAPLTGVVSGTVRLKGEWWPEGNMKVPRAIQGMPIDALETLTLGDGGSMANVYVAVKSGLGDRTVTAPDQAVVLNQIGSLYSPRVLGVMTNQPIDVRNLDELLHNARFSPVRNPKIAGHGPRGAPEIHVFQLPELAIRVGCDIHPWMRAWIHVSDHPFFAVTGVDGKFDIKDLPPGDYEILAWHERFHGAPLVAKVKVEAGQTAPLDFTFTAPLKADR